MGNNNIEKLELDYDSIDHNNKSLSHNFRAPRVHSASAKIKPIEIPQDLERPHKLFVILL